MFTKWNISKLWIVVTPIQTLFRNMIYFDINFFFSFFFGVTDVGCFERICVEYFSCGVVFYSVFSIRMYYTCRLTLYLSSRRWVPKLYFCEWQALVVPLPHAFQLYVTLHHNIDTQKHLQMWHILNLFHLFTPKS
jgi:hypothetical protein